MTNTPDPRIDIAALAAELDDEPMSELVDQIARFFDRFGFRRNLGRIWAALYVAPGPLTQADLAELLELSAGLISSGLKELEHYGAVRVVMLRGSRATHYEAEERLMRIVASILTKRELPSVRKLRETVRAIRAQGYVPTTAAPGRDDEARAASFERRLRAMERLCDLYDTLTGLVTRVSRLPAAAIENTMRVVAAARFLEAEPEPPAPHAAPPTKTTGASDSRAS